MKSKQTVILHIINKLQSQLTSFQNDYQALQSALANETKSSAGDKYETGREMITQEVNKVSDQINKQELFIQKLKQIDSNKPVIIAGENALVESSMGTFFIGIPLGVVEIENEKVFFISFQSPIYQAMRNLKAGDHFIWQNKQVDIIDIK